MKLLVIEDEPKVAAFLKQGLEESGFEVDVVYDGEMGRKFALSNDYDLILLDLIIPYINGIDLCKQIRDFKQEVPILMITALGTTDDKLTGFDAGADDYLVKPFDFKELLARINALTKRSRNVFQTSNILKVSGVELDLKTRTVTRDKMKIELTAKEMSLLELFMRNYGRVITRAEIGEKVWEVTFDRGTNIIEVYINVLRKKIDKDFPVKLIHTRVGVGYYFKEE